MSNALVPAVVIGGVAYTLTRADAPVQQPGGATNYKAPSYGSTIGQALDQGAGRLDVSAPPKSPVGGSSVKLRIASFAGKMGLTKASTYDGAPLNIDPQLKQKMDLAEQYAEKRYNEMDAVARGAAADYLNEKYAISPKLTGHESWKAITVAVAGATGAAAGVSACAATGVGSAVAGLCGKVGALVGAYLGAKLSDFVDKNYDEVKHWLSSKWGSLEHAVSEAYEETKDAIGDAIDWINPF